MPSRTSSCWILPLDGPNSTGCWRAWALFIASATKSASSESLCGCRRPTALGCGRRHHLVTFRSIPSQRPLVPFLAKVTDADLRGCGLSFAKIRSIRAIGHAAEHGQLEPGRVMRMDHVDRTACLTKIPGIGPWTADMIGIFYCGDPDIWPDGDLVARRTLQLLVGKRSSTVRVALTFSPWRSRLAMAMWRAVDQGLL